MTKSSAYIRWLIMTPPTLQPVWVLHKDSLKQSIIINVKKTRVTRFHPVEHHL